MKLRVLFLAANPRELTPLALEAEVHEIYKKLAASEFGEEIELVPHWSTRPDDLIQRFNEDPDWHVVHFSGHGSSSHEIVLEDEDGRAKPVSKHALQRLFRVFGRKARVAVFNACYSEGQAEAVVEHIDCAIGMANPVGDAAAILFAASFYRAIGFGKSIQEAFDQGLLAIELEDIAEVDTPRIRSKAGFNPNDLRLLSGLRPYQVEDEWTKLAPGPPERRDDQKWHTFLSYRSIHRPWALNLHDVLVRHGYEVFLDQFSIRPGTRLEGRLEEGLYGSRTGILVWSPASGDSKWCMKEYRTMLDRRRKEQDFHFVTLRIGGDLPEEVQQDVWIDFREHPDGPNGGGLMKLLFALADAPLTGRAVEFAAQQDEESRRDSLAIEARVELADRAGLKCLYEEGGVAWKSSAILGGKVAHGLISIGAYDEALEILDDVQRRFPRAVRPKQLRALALARRGRDGDLDEAQEILAMLRADGQQDPETLGIYARTWMERYVLSGKRVDLRRSRKLYADAFARAPDDTYTGINAAAKSVLLGERGIGRDYAEQVLDAYKITGPSDYFEEVTVAEAHLILDHWDRAAEKYASAVLKHPGQFGSYESTLTQARRLREAMGLTDEQWHPIEKAFEA